MIAVLVLVALVWFCRRAIVLVVLRIVVFAIGFALGRTIGR